MTKTPYDGGPIFDAVEPLKSVIAKVEAKRNDPNDKFAKHYAGPEFYTKMYSDASKRLSGPDMLTVDQAAVKLGITAAEFEDMANNGQAVLIQIGRKKAVPAWQFGDDGKIDGLKLDIAREFVLEGKSYFKFLDYIAFMTTETVNIVSTLSDKKLRDIFKKAGVGDYKCSLTVEATMNQLADQRSANPEFFDTLVKHLDDAVTHGGWDPSGGLSRPFRDKYNIPGLTIDEDRMAYVKKAQKAPKP